MNIAIVAVTFDEQGVIFGSDQMPPERPKNVCLHCVGKGWITGVELPCGYCNPGGEWRSSKTAYQKYSESLTLWKSQAVRFENQDAAASIIFPTAYETFKAKFDTIYHLSNPIECEVKDSFDKIENFNSPENQNRDNAVIGYITKVLSIKSQPEEKQESQEELFRQVVEMFSREHKKYGRPDYTEIKKHFTITRNQSEAHPETGNL